MLNTDPSLNYIKLSDVTLNGQAAIGDGSQSDAAILQAAVSQAASENKGLVLDWGTSGKGVYRTWEIDLTGNNVPLFIDGQGVTLEPYDGNSRFAILNIQTNSSNRANGFAVMNLNINASNTQYGIYVNNSQQVALSRIQVVNASSYGIYVYGYPDHGVWNPFLGDIVSSSNNGGVALKSDDPNGQPRVGLVQMVNVASDGNGTYELDSNGQPYSSGGIGFLIDGAGVDADGCSAESDSAAGLQVVNGAYGNFRGSYFENDGNGRRWVASGSDCVYPDSSICASMKDQSFVVNSNQSFELDGRYVGYGSPSASSGSFELNPSKPGSFSKFSWVDPLIFPQTPGLALSVDSFRNPAAPDDTQAISDALYIAAQRHMGLEFTAGKTYYTSTGVRIANGNIPLYINGNGATIRTTQSGIDGIYIENPQNTSNFFTLRDLNVECNYTGANGLHIYGAQHIYLRNIDVGHCNNLGFFAEGGIGYGIYYSTFENISAHGNVYTGIYMSTDPSVYNGSDPSGTYIAANAMLGLTSNWNGSYGFKFIYASERCDHCTANDNDGSGIDGEDSLYLYFSDTTLIGNKQGDYYMAPYQSPDGGAHFTGVMTSAVN